MRKLQRLRFRAKNIAEKAMAARWANGKKPQGMKMPAWEDLAQVALIPQKDGTVSLRISVKIEINYPANSFLATVQTKHMRFVCLISVFPCFLFACRLILCPQLSESSVSPKFPPAPFEPVLPIFTKFAPASRGAVFCPTGLLAQELS